MSDNWVFADGNMEDEEEMSSVMPSSSGWQSSTSGAEATDDYSVMLAKEIAAINKRKK